MSKPSRWNWFISVNIGGKWIITDGHADVTNSGNSLKAILLHALDADPYACVGVQVVEDGGATAVVESFQEGVPSYSLRGQLYMDDEALTLLLTDGCTVLGLARGKRSIEPNLA